VRINRDPIEVGESSRRNRGRADDQNSDGIRDYERGRHNDAIDHFERALRYDEWHVLAKYNLACNLNLVGRADDALDHLEELMRWDISESDERMARARVDDDFESLRTNERFQAITGYTRTQLLNGAGQGGLGAVGELRDSLESEGFHIASYGYDRHDRMRTLIYYAPGFEEQADTVSQLVDAEGVSLEPMSFGSEFHLVISYGSTGGAQGSLRRPLVQGTWDGTIISGDPEEAGEDAIEAGEDAVEAIEDPEGAAQEWMPGQ